MKFGTKVLIDPRNFPAEIWKSRPMFRPSPHRRVYQNFTRNGDKTPKNCVIWLKLGIWSQIMLLNEFTKIIRSRNIFGPSPHRRVYQNFYKNESRTLKINDKWLEFGIWSQIMVLKKYTKNERSRNIFGPSPHRRVYQNLKKKLFYNWVNMWYFNICYIIAK